MLYKTVVYESRYALDDSVNELLKQGWDLYGYPAIAVSSNSDGEIITYLQAMIKIADDVEQPAQTEEEYYVEHHLCEVCNHKVSLHIDGICELCGCELP